MRHHPNARNYWAALEASSAASHQERAAVRAAIFVLLFYCSTIQRLRLDGGIVQAVVPETHT